MLIKDKHWPESSDGHTGKGKQRKQNNKKKNSPKEAADIQPSKFKCELELAGRHLS